MSRVSSDTRVTRLPFVAGRAGHVDGRAAAADDDHPLAQAEVLTRARTRRRYSQPVDDAAGPPASSSSGPAAWRAGPPPRGTRASYLAPQALEATRRRSRDARCGSRRRGRVIRCDLPVDHVLRQPVLGDAIAHKPAELRSVPRRP